MKKNKLLSVLLLIFILIIILGLVIIRVLIFPNYAVDKYGNRLDGIENVLITDTRLNEIKNSFEGSTGFNIDKMELVGRIVDIYVKVDNDFDVKSAKENASNLVGLFSEDELKYYDFQVFITGEGDKYPMIGYKNKISEGLSWNYEGEN